MLRTKTIALFAAMIMLLGLFCPAQAQTLTYALGDTIHDFTFTTYDGQEIRFSDVLKDKDAVLINIWASWCGPCRSEFPYMQQAYEMYQDKVEVIALSSEPTDTPDKLANFAQEYGLTFKIGQDPVDFLRALQIGSIPTTMMIDRFGTICLIETGAQPSVESFERMFDAFLGNDYTESVLYRGLPAAKPNVAAASEEELSAAIEASASNPTNAAIWPMLPAEKDGRNVLVSSNAAQASSKAAVSAVMTAKAGDAIIVTFKTSTESVFDLMEISVNGSVVKLFAGEHDWIDYAIPVDADGEYNVTISYAKDHVGDAGEDAVWIDRIALAENAQAAPQANPVYPPVAAEPSILVKDQAAREIKMEDATGLLNATFGNARYFIAGSDQATIFAQLSNEFDPEGSFLYTSHGMLYPLMECTADGGYELPITVDSINTTGYACTSVMLYPENTGTVSKAVVLFRDEENVNLLCEYNKLGSWDYADAAEQTAIPAVPDQVKYMISCIDQDGNPVAGTMIQVCDETTCQVFISDEKGQCTFTAEPKAWEVHVLMAPQGYAAGENAVITAPVEGGTIRFILTKQ